MMPSQANKPAQPTMATRIASRLTPVTSGLLVEVPSLPPAVPATIFLSVPRGTDAEGMVLVTASTGTLRLVGRHLKDLCQGSEAGMEVDDDPGFLGSCSAFGTPAKNAIDTPAPGDQANRAHGVALTDKASASRAPGDQAFNATGVALADKATESRAHATGGTADKATEFRASGDKARDATGAALAADEATESRAHAAGGTSDHGGLAGSGTSDTAGYLLYVEILLAADPATALVLNPRTPKCVTHVLELPDGDCARAFAAVFNEAVVDLGLFGLAWPATLSPGPSTMSVRPAVKRAKNPVQGQPAWPRAKRWGSESWPVAVIDAITKLSWSGADPCLGEGALRLMRRAINFSLSANRFGDWVISLTPPPGRWREFMAILPALDLVVEAVSPPLQWIVSTARAALPAATPALAMRVMEAARRHFDPHGSVTWAPLVLHCDHWVSVGEAAAAFAPATGGSVSVSVGHGDAVVPVSCERGSRGDPVNGCDPVTRRTIPTGPAIRGATALAAASPNTGAAPAARQLGAAGAVVRDIGAVVGVSIGAVSAAPNVHSLAAFPVLDAQPLAAGYALGMPAGSNLKKRPARTGSDDAESGLTTPQARLAPALRKGGVCEPAATAAIRSNGASASHLAALGNLQVVPPAVERALFLRES